MLQEIDTGKIQKIKSQLVCPVELALRVLGGKWRGSIMYQLKDGPLRFNHLKIRVQDAVVDYDDADNILSNKLLSLHLSELCDFGLISKTSYDSHAEYGLTPKGQSSIPILLDLFDRGATHF